MSFEIENKYRVSDRADLERRLAGLRAARKEAVEHRDLYLAHPDRDFAATDEALRIRRVGDENAITYKGPKRAGPTKTREELEVSFGSGDEPLRKLTTLFERLGFRPVIEVRKRRTAYSVPDRGREMEVVIDEADALGTFVEVEALAADEADLPAAQAAVASLASELGLHDVEPRSYLRMRLDARLGKETA